MSDPRAGLAEVSLRDFWRYYRPVLELAEREGLPFRTHRWSLRKRYVEPWARDLLAAMPVKNPYQFREACAAVLRRPDPAAAANVVTTSAMLKAKAALVEPGLVQEQEDFLREAREAT